MQSDIIQKGSKVEKRSDHYQVTGQFPSGPNLNGRIFTQAGITKALNKTQLPVKHVHAKDNVIYADIDVDKKTFQKITNQQAISIGMRGKVLESHRDEDGVDVIDAAEVDSLSFISDNMSCTTGLHLRLIRRKNINRWLIIGLVGVFTAMLLWVLVNIV